MTPEEQMAMIQQMLVMSGYLQPMMPGAGIVPGGDDGNASTDENRSLSFARNFNNYIADPITGAWAGPQGFSAPAFAPVQTQEAVDLPGARAMAAALRSNPDTLSYMIAEEIARGGDENTAFAKIRSVVNGEGTDPAVREALITQIQPLYAEGDDFSYDEVIDPDTGLPRPDWRALKSQIDDFAKAVRSDPGYDIPVTEQFTLSDGSVVELPVSGFKVSEEDSPLTQKFRELGLPTPFEQYQRQDFMPQWMVDREDQLDQRRAVEQQDAQMRQSQAIANQAEQRAMLERLIRQRDSRAEGVADRVMSGERRLTGLEGVLGKAAKAAEGPIGAIGRGLSAIAPGGASVFSVFGDAVDRPDEPAVAEPERRNPFIARLMDQQIRPGIRDRVVSQARSRDPIQRKIIEMQRQQTFAPNAVNQAGQDWYDSYKRRVHNKRRLQQNPEYIQAMNTYLRAQAEGRTPLSDVLTGRRAQATAAGIPQRNPYTWMG